MRSQALDDVLRRLEHRADIVLVDAPAMLAVSDAINLTPKVDAVIVLTRIPIVKRSALDELKRILDTAPVAKVGFVVTGTTGDDGVGTYGYGYGYGSQDARRAASVP
jgi:Mrp family chromosome partitioning ATPase